MLDFLKQKDKWNQIVRERKYRPSFFGFPVHFDWKFLLFLFLLCLILISIFTVNRYTEINNLLEKDFSNEAEIKKIDKVDIEKFDEILKRVESN